MQVKYAVCYICKKKKDLVLKMTTKKPHKVRDHCHYT